MSEKLKRILEEFFTGNSRSVTEMDDLDFVRFLTQVNPESMSEDIESIRQQLTDIEEKAGIVLDDVESAKLAIAEILKLLTDTTE